MDYDHLKAAGKVILSGVVMAALQGALGYLAGLDFSQFGVPAGAAVVFGSILHAMKSPIRR